MRTARFHLSRPGVAFLVANVAYVLYAIFLSESVADYLRARGGHAILAAYLPVFAISSLDVWMVLGYLRRRRTARAGVYCRQCGYDLRASSTICPECGQPFDRQGRRTFDSRSDMWGIRRQWRWTWRLVGIPTCMLILAMGVAWLVYLHYEIPWQREQAALDVFPAVRDTVVYRKVRQPPGVLNAWLGYLFRRAVNVTLVDTPVSVEGARHLASLEYLEILYIARAGLTDAGLAELSSLKYLKSLSLSRVPITDHGLQSLAAMVNLAGLDLSQTHITDAGVRHLAGLKNLEWLGLADTPIAGTGLVYLRDLPNLQQLDLSGVTLSEEGWQNLKAMPSLTQLIVGGPEVSPKDLRHLGDLPNLQTLFLHHLSAPAAAMEELRHLRGLRSLRLEAMSLGDAELRTIGTMSWLRDLSLRRTQVTDAGVAELKSLAGLRSLDLSETKVTDACLVHLRGLPSLRRVYAFNSAVTTVGAVEFTKSCPGALAVEAGQR